MTVVSFVAYKMHNQYVEMDDPCDRPFHKEGYVFEVGDEKVCLRCVVAVKLIDHPSMEEPQWYG